MLVLAHRGLHDDARENTLAAFEAAVAAGADGIETDVRLTRDGVAILMHDPKVRRRTVASMTHSELSRAAGYHVPTLAQALRRFDVFWDVEIKSPDAVDAAVRVLRGFVGTRRMVVTSFRRDILARVGKALDLPCGQIVSRAPLGVRPAPGALVVWKLRLATVRRIRAARARGQQVFVYGPRTRRDHERCARLGVDAVITDWPKLLRA